MLEIKKLGVVEWRHEKVEVFIFRHNNNSYFRVFDAKRCCVCRCDG